MTYWTPSEPDTVWEKEGIDYATVSRGETRSYKRAPWNGYCRFAKRPVIETGYDGILTYAPVHGGITYANEDADGSMVYGFDCAHLNDENNADLFDHEKVKTLTVQMGESIRIAAGYEERYLLARTNEDKSAIIEEYRDACKLWSDAEVGEHEAFGVLINLLGGQL